MDEKTNFYVFAKKEIALIFLFMIVIAVTSFVLGVKVGKSYSYEKAGFTKEDRENILMNSRSEEVVEDLVKKDKSTEEDKKLKRKKVLDSTYEKLEEEFNKLDQDVNKAEPPEASAPQVKQDKATLQASSPSTKKKEEKVDPASIVSGSPKALEKKAPPEMTYEEPAQMVVPEASMRDQVRGKFTIQLGSYQSMVDAQSFADGFRVRGYKVIVNEVELNGRGIWFRVSLGIFDSVSEAKSYVLREKVLFKAQDYVIGRFN